MTYLESRPVESSESAPAWHSWLETAALCSLALAAGALAAGRDPLALRTWLAWLALAPLLSSLRYGAGHGVACGAALSGALLAAARWGATAAEMPMPELALGWLVAGLLPGQFRDAWARRLEQAEGEASELRARLSDLSRDLSALRLSHDRLQREAPGSPSTLQDALAAFERRLGGGGALDAGSLEAIGGKVLALFRECASVRAATLHLVDRQGRVGAAVAALGARKGELPAAVDPLVRESIRSGQVVSARDAPSGRGALAAVPLVDAEWRVRGVVAIREIPFLALHAETLAILGTLGARAGIALARALRPAPVATGRLPRSTRSPGFGLEAAPHEDGLVA